MQIVYISNRPQVLATTLHDVALFAPFIDEVIVLVPSAARSQFEAISPPQKFSIVSENHILSESQIKNLASIDHQRRNYTLRQALTTLDEIDDIFIMSDDDSRPLTDISITTFLENDKYHRYYFYHLAEWNNHRTEFDRGQLSTRAILNQHGLQQRSYASHMPQIIDKALFLESSDFFKSYAENQPLCEWSSYFNYAPSIKPSKFHSPSPHLTLCWPENPLAWKVAYRPKQYLFENFTPALYENDHVFAEFTTIRSELDQDSKHIKHANALKIVKWEQNVLESLYPEQSKGLAKYLNWRTWVNKASNHLNLRS